ncbi:MAG: hypothetical protein ACJ71S_06425 [Acidobacteriaceae bacterium]
MSTALQLQDRREPAQQQPRQTLEPTTLKEAWEFSEIVAKSELAPKDYRGKPANVLVAIQFGKELGVPPMQALQGIAVVNGRPAVWGDLMWALVTNHPDFEDSEEVVTEDRATVTLTRRGRKPVTDTFTLADAKLAGLLGNAVWKTYPKRMLLWRARTFAARTLFPDALKGMISVEEAGDYDGGTTISGTLGSSNSPATSPTTTAAPDPVITQDQARDFGKAWKSSGYTMEEAKAWLKSTLNLESSLKIPASRYSEAMTWAATAKGHPTAAVSGDSAAVPTQQATQEISPEEKNCREAFGLLDWNLAEQADACQRHNGNWTALLAELSGKLNERDAQ